MKTSKDTINAIVLLEHSVILPEIYLSSLFPQNMEYFSLEINCEFIITFPIFLNLY